ncbi:prion-like-(Q/N-rich) domain-bearing protein 25 [Frieseomelitta varia]|uniref:prion-like-(Q/N-rich) domain-bearing protein 25 n=1 Tax=Frieseomelitta varia TaxID=561572 RepID=UPI001CB69A6F|nr:prion-like-(Q/N-rich) domain-bearing protein 25 [Frieseomelitta varia]
MNDQILRILLFFAVFRSLSCQQSTQDGTIKIGERCERDRNCIPHAFCRSQMTCLCDQYYSPTPDNSMCIASAGLSCTKDSVCRSMTNAMCRQGVCACKDSYILDINNSSNCISRPLVVGDRCQRTDECQDVFDRAMCINGRCQCITSYHFVNETGKCVPTRFLYNLCTESYECRSLHNETVLECRNGECVSTGGQGTYTKGSTLAFLGILVTLLPFIH